MRTNTVSKLNDILTRAQANGALPKSMKITGTSIRQGGINDILFHQRTAPADTILLAGHTCKAWKDESAIFEYVMQPLLSVIRASNALAGHSNVTGIGPHARLPFLTDENKPVIYRFMRELFEVGHYDLVGERSELCEFMLASLLRFWSTLMAKYGGTKNLVILITTETAGKHRISFQQLCDWAAATLADCDQRMAIRMLPMEDAVWGPIVEALLQQLAEMKLDLRETKAEARASHVIIRVLQEQQTEMLTLMRAAELRQTIGSPVRKQMSPVAVEQPSSASSLQPPTDVILSSNEFSAELGEGTAATGPSLHVVSASVACGVLYITFFFLLTCIM